MKPGRRSCMMCAACAVCLVVCGGAVQAQSSVKLARAGVARPAAIALRPMLANEAAPARTGRPSLEPARIAGEALAGAYAGLGGYFIGSWLGGELGTLLSETADSTQDRMSFVGGVIGAGFATAASVTAIGNIGDQTGSFSTALIGTGAGMAVGALLNQIIYGHARLPSEGESSRMRWVEASLEAILPSIGATIAFNSSRRYK